MTSSISIHPANSETVGVRVTHWTHQDHCPDYYALRVSAANVEVDVYLTPAQFTHLAPAMCATLLNPNTDAPSDAS